MFTFFKKKKINSEILKYIKLGIVEVFLEKVNFEAARSYAVDNGTSDVDPFTKEPNKYDLSISKEVDGIMYQIYFERMKNNGTRIAIHSPEHSKALREKIHKTLNEGGSVMDLKNEF